ncbi:MAG: LlaJI family restriction endonuclease [Prevotellaceae bacterium]|nr:LlaJI family restriction endonuclease [Prevotellaceae bacterium]
MKLLIEEYQYEVSAVADVLHGIDSLSDAKGKVSLHYVGYFYNKKLSDCVFILPRVLLKDRKTELGTEELVFGKYKPEAIIDLSADVVSPESEKLSPEERDFIYKFAVWIYRAIVVYKNDKKDTTNIIYEQHIAQVGRGQRRIGNTYLDILLSLLWWARDNKNFVLFTLRNIHAGFNKINWNRTIATQMPTVKGNRPVYLNLVNKKRQVNFDEELLTIFYSILNYISETYGFHAEVDLNFQLIRGKQFENYLRGYGLMRLMQIKYKYFSDKALQLWTLCHSFFSEAKEVTGNTDNKDYLLAKNFNLVFEAIIDELIGDKEMPDGIEREQEDGKIIDHLFTGPSLISPDAEQVYYIGDSKYYKIGYAVGKESVAKQYTYARNIIQANLDIFYEKHRTPEIRLRDDLTEGYNVIPNFFISAMIDDKRLDYSDDGISRTDRAKDRYRKYQFPNRLFDRDTLLISHYDVNFLFVLSLYARDNASQKAQWKEKVRLKFAKEIRQWLRKDYEFYAMRAKTGVDGQQRILSNFKKVVGKVFTPYEDRTLYSLALERKGFEEENGALVAELTQWFDVELCDLEQDPKEVLRLP